MKFLTVPECERWCYERGLPLPARLRDRPFPSEYVSHEFTIPEDAGARVALCGILWSLAGKGTQGQRLLWIHDWSVWPSGEHMPLFTKWRAAFGESRALIDARGHLVEPSDDQDGLSVLVMACLFLWDCWMFTETGVVAIISHDEFGFVLERRDLGHSDVRAQLKGLGVLTS